MIIYYFQPGAKDVRLTSPAPGWKLASNKSPAISRIIFYKLLIAKKAIILHRIVY